MAPVRHTAPSPTHAPMTRPVMTYRELNTIAPFHERLCAILDNSCAQLDIRNQKDPRGHRYCPLCMKRMMTVQRRISPTLKVTADDACIPIC